MLNAITDDNISLNSLDTYCSVCLSSLINDISKLSCNHSFHEKCINEWLKEKNTCPLCRSSIIKPNLDVLPIINNIRQHTNNNYNQRYNYKKILTLILTILILFNFCSNFYLDYNISSIKNSINESLILNYTLLNKIPSNNDHYIPLTFIFDIFYVMLYYYTCSYLIYKPNFCCVLTISALYMITIIIHQMHISDIFKRFNNDIYEFTEKYKYNFILSVILYYSSIFLKTVLLIIYLHLYVI
jgi:hypothetical protein